MELEPKQYLHTAVLVSLLACVSNFALAYTAYHGNKLWVAYLVYSVFLYLVCAWLAFEAIYEREKEMND